MRGATDQPERLATNEKRKLLIWTAVGIVTFIFFLDDVLGWINGGGVFSIISAARSANDRAAAIDVDSAGLRSLTVAMTTLIGSFAVGWLDLDLRRRAVALTFILTFVGGAFVLDGVYDQAIVGHFMIERGYHRCPPKDREVGNGKSKVWFNSYVLNARDCAAEAVQR